PSLYRRFCSTPATRARTSAERVADSLPTRSRVIGTDCAFAVTTLTSTDCCGGGPPFLPHPTSSTAVVAEIASHRREAGITLSAVTERTRARGSTKLTRA